MGTAVAGALTGKVTPPQSVCLLPTPLESVAFTPLNPASPFLTSFHGQSSPASRQEAKSPFGASPTPTTKPLVSGPTSRRPAAAGAAQSRTRPSTLQGQTAQPRMKAPGSPSARNCGGGQDTALLPRVGHSRCVCDTDEEAGASSYTGYLACHLGATTAAEAGRAQVCLTTELLSPAPRGLSSLQRAWGPSVGLGREWTQESGIAFKTTSTHTVFLFS